MNDLSSLIERVKAAKEPSRELDCLIDAVVKHDREVLNAGQQILARNRKPPHDSYLVGTIDPGRNARNFAEAGGNPPAPRYTSSVDAVLALIEDKLPGWRWGVSSAAMKTGVYPDGKPSYGEGFAAHVTKSSPLRPMPVLGRGSTPALALLTALLTALKEQSNG